MTPRRGRQNTVCILGGHQVNSKQIRCLRLLNVHNQWRRRRRVDNFERTELCIVHWRCHKIERAGIDDNLYIENLVTGERDEENIDARPMYKAEYTALHFGGR